MTDQIRASELLRNNKDDTWLCDSTEDIEHGVLCARLTVKGRAKFYFRYYTTNRKRVRLLLGYYDPEGIMGITLGEARQKATELSFLHRAGITNIREHLQQCSRPLSRLHKTRR